MDAKKYHVFRTIEVYRKEMGRAPTFEELRIYTRMRPAELLYCLREMEDDPETMVVKERSHGAKIEYHAVTGIIEE